MRRVLEESAKKGEFTIEKTTETETADIRTTGIERTTRAATFGATTTETIDTDMLIGV